MHSDEQWPISVDTVCRTECHRFCTRTRPQFLRNLWHGSAGFLTLSTELQLDVFVEVKNAVSGGTLLMSRLRFAAGKSSVSSSSLKSSTVKQHCSHEKFSCTKQSCNEILHTVLYNAA